MSSHCDEMLSFYTNLCVLSWVDFEKSQHLTIEVISLVGPVGRCAQNLTANTKMKNILNLMSQNDLKTKA